jgi:hypothetical protein
MRAFVQEHDTVLAHDIDGCTIDGGTQCLKCGKPMGLCAHCFSRDIYHLIKLKKPELAEEFMSRFDFDLRRTMLET